MSAGTTKDGQTGEREFTRVSADVYVRLRMEDEWFETDGVQNVSLKGMLLEFAEDFGIPEGAHVKVEVGIGGPLSDTRVNALGQVVRVDGGLVAVELTEIYGADGLAHMRNLILYNSVEPQRVNSEFANHLGIKAVETG